MNLASTLLKTIIAESDIETWSNCQKNYFPSEYESVWTYIDKFVQEYNRLPTFDDIKLEARDSSVRNKLMSLEKIEDLEIEANNLLEYLKNEYVQIEIMDGLEKFLTNTIATEAAEENLQYLQEMVLDIEQKVDLKPVDENMQKMPLFEPKESLENYISLGLHHEFDRLQTFGPKQYIAIGAPKGKGKSFTCANLAVNTYESGNSVMYFTIEMTGREILQRCCSIATGVPQEALRKRNLSIGEWKSVAEWWSKRYEDGERVFQKYLQTRDFDAFHLDLSRHPLRETQLDIIYSPSLTLGNIRAELDKKINRLKPKMVIVDYINQVKRSANFNPRMGQYDWTEQIEVSKALKEYAQAYDVLMVSAYQIDSTGEARFSKGILDSMDAAYVLDNHNKEGNIISFNCAKMRNAEERSFTSQMDWTSLKIGPEPGQIPKDEDEDIDDSPTEFTGL